MICPSLRASLSREVLSIDSCTSWLTCEVNSQKMRAEFNANTGLIDVIGTFKSMIQ